MKGSDYILLVLTFITGMCAGAYLYITYFAPAYVAEDIPSVEDTYFELSGEMYGACEAGDQSCASFHLKENRTYTYVPAQAQDRTEDKLTGTLDRRTFSALEDVLMNTDIALLQADGGYCAAKHGGTDYRYRVVFDGEAYLLDTCGTAFVNTSLARAFEALWPRLATSTASRAIDIDGNGVERFLEQEIYDRLHGGN